MKHSRCWAVCYILLAGWVCAESRLGAEWTELDGGAAKTRPLSVTFSAGAVRIDTSAFSRPEKSALLYRADRRVFVYLDYSAREYMELPAASDMDQVTDLLSGVLEQAAGSAAPACDVRDIVKEPERDTVNGMPSRRFTVTMSGPCEQEMWLTTREEARLSRAEYQLLKELASSYRSVRNLLAQWPDFKDLALIPVDGFLRADGFPARLTHYESGRPQCRVDLHRSEEVESNPDAFRVPEDFKRRPLF